jgi:hypothetical protein
MTEFKIGDKVLVKPGEVSLTGWTPEDYTTPLPVTHVDDYGRVVSLAGVLEYSFRPEQLTPALDPSKVKAGDTVTVRIEEEYAHTRHPAYTISDTTAYGDPVMVGPFVLDQEHITLLDHQPAPEPEPEWKPGTVYTDAAGTRFWAVNSEHGVMFIDEYGDGEDPAYVTEPRQLVVIDPADVDADMLVDTAHNNAMTKREIVEHVLGSLGLSR